MIDERTEELAALHAFDLLEGEERAGFETVIARRPELLRLVDELRASTSALAAVAPDAIPPDSLRERVLAIPGSRQSVPAASASVIPFRLPAWSGWAVAAGLALATGWFAQSYLAVQGERLVERERATLARVETDGIRQLLEAEQILARQQIASLRTAETRVAQLQREADLAQLKVSSLASLLANSPEAQAIAVWSPAAQQGILTVEKLPALAADKDYQLWVVDPQYPIPVDGGVFRVDPATGTARVEFRPRQPVAEVAKFAISLERKGGVPKAEGPMVLLSP